MIFMRFLDESKLPYFQKSGGGIYPPYPPVAPPLAWKNIFLPVTKQNLCLKFLQERDSENVNIFKEVLFQRLAMDLEEV